MFFGWEKHGDWVAHDYYPPPGGEMFRRGAELARKDRDYRLKRQVLAEKESRVITTGPVTPLKLELPPTRPQLPKPLHQHQVAADAVNLGVQDGPAVGGDAETREGLLIDCGDGLDGAGLETEELNGSPGEERGGEVDAFIHHRKIGPNSE